MSIFTAAVLVVFCSVVANTAWALSQIACGPSQLETEVLISGMYNSALVSGIGRFHKDCLVTNVTVLNVTMLAPEGSAMAPLTMLHISDISTGRNYKLNTATGECSFDPAMSGTFKPVRSVYMGLDTERLDSQVFVSQTDKVNVLLVTTKNFCIPVYSRVQSATSFVVLNFINPTKGISNNDVFNIPDKCKAL